MDTLSTAFRITSFLAAFALAMPATSFGGTQPPEPPARSDADVERELAEIAEMMELQTRLLEAAESRAAEAESRAAAAERRAAEADSRAADAESRALEAERLTIEAEGRAAALTRPSEDDSGGGGWLWSSLAIAGGVIAALMFAEQQ